MSRLHAPLLNEFSFYSCTKQSQVVLIRGMTLVFYVKEREAMMLDFIFPEWEPLKICVYLLPYIIDFVRLKQI